jgi:hypothetical protein
MMSQIHPSIHPPSILLHPSRLVVVLSIITRFTTENDRRITHDGGPPHFANQSSVVFVSNSAHQWSATRSQILSSTHTSTPHPSIQNSSTTTNSQPQALCLTPPPCPQHRACPLPVPHAPPIAGLYSATRGGSRQKWNSTKKLNCRSGNRSAFCDACFLIDNIHNLIQEQFQSNNETSSNIFASSSNMRKRQRTNCDDKLRIHHPVD